MKGKEVVKMNPLKVGSIGAGLFLMGIVLGEILKTTIVTVDELVYSWISASHLIVPEFFDGLAIGFTWLGEAWALAFIAAFAAIVLYLKKRKLASYTLLASTALSGILVFVIKAITDRARPVAFVEIDAIGMSFPSGHALMAVVIYGFLAYLIARRSKNPRRVYLYATALILLVGSSRLWLGVHWLSDVVAGFLLGMLVLWFFIVLYKKCRD